MTSNEADKDKVTRREKEYEVSEPVAENMSDERERLLRAGELPHSNIKQDAYEHIEASLPPETKAAMRHQADIGQADTPSTLGIEPGYTVEALDGKVGTVEQLLKDEDSSEAYMSVREGLVFKHHVSIPLSAVSRVEDRTVYLNIEKAYVKVIEAGEETHGEGTQPMSH